MNALTTVAVHSSQYPDQVREDLRRSLLSRVVNHKFHYDSVKQAQKWLRLHRTYSPAVTDPDCGRIYDSAFQAAAELCRGDSRVHLVGLGCGGGAKDVRCLKLLGERVPQVSYTPCDASTALVLTASQTAVGEGLRQEGLSPFVCDLGSGLDLREVLDSLAPAGARRVVTFFGMLPNFEPRQVLPTVRAALAPGDLLLLSANLAPGSDYAAGMHAILPLYENELTRDWLLTLLLDLGLERTDGELEFGIEDVPGAGDLKRVIAHFRLARDRSIELGDESIDFRRGERIQVFFSYRHTPEKLSALALEFGLRVAGQWVNGSGEEGIFLCLPEA